MAISGEAVSANFITETALMFSYEISVIVCDFDANDAHIPNLLQKVCHNALNIEFLAASIYLLYIRPLL